MAPPLSLLVTPLGVTTPPTNGLSNSGERGQPSRWRPWGQQGLVPTSEMIYFPNGFSLRRVCAGEPKTDIFLLVHTLYVGCGLTLSENSSLKATLKKLLPYR